MAVAVGNPGGKTNDVKIGKCPAEKRFVLLPCPRANGSWRSPDGKTLATADFETAHFRDVQTGKIISSLRSEGPTIINQLLFCRDGKTLVSFSPQ